MNENLIESVAIMVRTNKDEQLTLDKKIKSFADKVPMSLPK